MNLDALERDGLVFAADLTRIGMGPRSIENAIRRGQLRRLRRGTFVRPDSWDAMNTDAQHVLRIAAVVGAARTNPVMARTSAAALWGMPLDSFPAEVVLLDAWRGGGRSEPGVVRTARGAATAEVVVRHGYQCTTLARTALDVCRKLPFQRSVPLLDWCMSEGNPLAVTKEELAAEASTMNVSANLWHAIDFATSLSSSIGESEARAVIHLMGYPRPQLQRRFRDVEGTMYSDFYFAEYDAIAEFDGKAKYTLNQYTRGDPAEVVWREKKREDRLRRQVRTVVRILTEDVRNPRSLERKFADAGIYPHRGGS